MPKQRPTFLVGMLAAVLLAACQDLPLVPKWDAQWEVPLPTLGIRVGNFFPGAVIFPGASADVSFPPQEQILDQAVGRVLEQQLRDAILKLTYTSTLPLTGADTLFIDSTQAGLSAATASRIAMPFSLAQTAAVGRGVVDTLSTAQLSMIQKARSLWVQMRGSLSNPSASPVVLTGADSLQFKLAMTVTIGISTR